MDLTAALLFLLLESWDYRNGLPHSISTILFFFPYVPNEHCTGPIIKIPSHCIQGEKGSDVKVRLMSGCDQQRVGPGVPGVY